MNIDADIVIWINSHGNAWLDAAMWTISRPSTWFPLYALLLLLLAYRFRNGKVMLLILLGFGIAVGLSDFTCSGILKPLVARLRPTHEPAIDPIRLIHGYTGGLYGFCSSHAANSIAIALLFSLLYKNKIATVCLMTWVAVVCYSRMYLGVHYPTDIIAGLLIGSLWALVTWLALKRWYHVDGEVARPGGS